MLPQVNRLEHKRHVVDIIPHNDLYSISNEFDSALIASVKIPDTDEQLQLLHRRFGHSSAAVIKRIFGLKVAKLPFCDGCALRNTRQRNYISRSYDTATVKSPFYKVHTDIVHMTQSINNEQYFATFVDDFSRFLWVRVLTKKSEVAQQFKKHSAKCSSIKDGNPSIRWSGRVC